MVNNFILYILKKINLLKVVFLIQKLKIFNLFKKELGINIYEERNKKIIISLTTYPKRFNIVYLTLETLLNQTKKPDKIVLYLSKDEIISHEIPIEILKLKNRGIEIIKVDENIKSYKKLIYAYKEFSSDLIITVDDDTIYPKNFINDIYEKHLKFSNCIIAYRCTVMNKLNNFTLTPYLSWKNKKIDKPSFNLFFTGVGGVLYPPNSLSNKVFNSDLFLSLSPTADDVWFKAMSLLNKTRVIQTYKKSIEFPTIDGSQNDALWKVNNEQNHNDAQLKKVFDYYKLYDYIKLKDIDVTNN